MPELLSGGAPLRGRAVLELVVRPFDFREAAAFWGLTTDPELAFRVNALVGGTPAYLEMCGGAGPAGLADFDGWVARWLLNPASAMFREGGQLLREEPSISDPTSYAATLAAISAGNYRRSEIAAALGRPSGALAHLLSGLADIGLVEQTDDALRGKRSVFHVAEPAVRLHQLVIGRHEPELVVGRASGVWASAADTVAAKIYGPHFADLARRWCLAYSAQETTGGAASHVRPTEISCREHRQAHELDLVVTETVPFGNDRIAAIGEAKATADLAGISQLERLEHMRGLLPAAMTTSLVKIILFARAGFTGDLLTTAIRRPDVELVDLGRLYNGE